MARNKQIDLLLEQVHIEEMTTEGKGLARHNGMVVFVSGAVMGDVADVQVYQRKKNFMEGRIANLLVPSPYRQEPYCTHFGYCGGCRLQHLTYEAQLQWKQKHVIDNLERIGKVFIPEYRPILPSAQTTRYRNKLQFSFSNKRWFPPELLDRAAELEQNAVGFHVPNQFDKVIDIQTCYHQAEPSNALRNQLKAFALRNGYTFFDIWLQHGFLRNLTVRNTTLGQWMVIVQFYDNLPEQIQATMQFIAEQFPEITSLFYVVNQKGNDTFDDLELTLYKGMPYIEEQMEHMRFRIGPKSFFQTNSRQAVELYKATRELAGLTGEEIVYDLYTGTGTIACFVANRAKKVVGIEYVEAAVQDAWLNAAINQVNNAVFIAGDMAQIFNAKLIAQHGKPDVIITDPPRAGMHELVVQAIKNSQAKKVVYVSCNPATQARDIALMADMYVPLVAQPVDMFPQTTHVENIVLLERRDIVEQRLQIE
ncbi:MAG: 23S rRNA (uracil(1939)-C(5))-methyltransferase RlmD [Cytophagales bacterium]|nr:23S rRNA (uracil(1939)-C(5))-methyltransferase RlmD [Bernardetiaceae bacterium]MDW8205362.1 23S rRNA (uracil(1939)-C(5))-methyltransferase RlmD [Cytophagales bacterium]